MDNTFLMYCKGKIFEKAFHAVFFVKQAKKMLKRTPLLGSEWEMDIV